MLLLIARRGGLIMAAMLLVGCGQSAESKYNARYIRLEDVNFACADHDAKMLSEDSVQFGPTTVTLDSVKMRLKINGQDYGALAAGDEVVLGETVTVNGQPRSPVD